MITTRQFGIVLDLVHTQVSLQIAFNLPPMSSPLLLTLNSGAAAADGMGGGGAPGGGGGGGGIRIRKMTTISM